VGAHIRGRGEGHVTQWKHHKGYVQINSDKNIKFLNNEKTSETITKVFLGD